MHNPSPLSQVRQLNLPRAIPVLALSPDGQRLAVGSNNGHVYVYRTDKMVQLWETKAKHSARVISISWNASGGKLLTNSQSGGLYVFDAATGKIDREIPHARVMHSAWSPAADVIALGGAEGVSIVSFAEPGRDFSFPTGSVGGLSWTLDGTALAISTVHGDLFVWRTEDRSIDRLSSRHTALVSRPCWSPDAAFLVAPCDDSTVSVWAAVTGRPIALLGGHLGSVRGAAFTPDGEFLLTTSYDRTIRIWSARSWNCVHVEYHSTSPFLSGIDAFPTGDRFAVVGGDRKSIRFLRFDRNMIGATAKPFRYRNAKIVLVGDSGVGKSGLAITLSGEAFAATESTHGRKVRRLFEETTEQDDALEHREIHLWDLAGQPGYRLVHQLHLSDVNVAVIVVDARSETDPLGGAKYWARAIRAAENHNDVSTPTLSYLVVAREDRGALAASAKRIEEFAKANDIAHVYRTSAKSGLGVEELRAALLGSVHWDAVPFVTSEAELKALLDLIRERRRTTIVVRRGELLRTLTERTPGSTKETFAACLQTLAAQGDISLLSFGDCVLLAPEVLDTYASLLVMAAQDEPDGMGMILEADVLSDDFLGAHDERIADVAQEHILISATIEEMLSRDIVLRESESGKTTLIFPSQLTRDGPPAPDVPGKWCYFAFRGPVRNIYATLVVRLANTGHYTQDQFWKNGIRLATADGVVGLVLDERDEGDAHIYLYGDASVQESGRAFFTSFVEAHLWARANRDSVVKHAIVACSHCNHSVPPAAVEFRRNAGHQSVFCSYCGNSDIPLPEFGLPRFAESGVAQAQEVANETRAREAGLTSAAAEMRLEFGDWAGSRERAYFALVFTDVVESTKLLVDVGDEQMESIRLAHFKQVREFIKANNGREVKTIGDGFMVAFPVVSDALQFALSVVDAPGHGRIRAVRAGVHVGEAHIRENDLFGKTVNFTARVQTVAANGGVAVSSETKAALEDVRERRFANLIWTKKQAALKGFASSEVWLVETGRKLKPSRYTDSIDS